MRLSIRKWHFVLGRGQHPVIILDALGRGHRSSFGKVVGCGFNTPNWIRYEGRTYIIEKDYQKIIRLLRGWIKKDPSKLKRLIDSGNKRMQDLIKKTAQWNRLHLRELSDKKLLRLIKEFFRYYDEITISFYTPFYAEDVIEAYLKQGLTTRSRRLDISTEKVIEVLTSKYVPTPMIKEKRDLLEIAQLIITKDLKQKYLKVTAKNLSRLPLAKKVLAHQRKYQSLNTYIFHVVQYQIAEVLKNLKKYLKVNPSKALANQNRERRNKFKEQRTLARKLKLTVKEKRIISIARGWNQFRNDRVYNIGLFQYNFKPILQEWGRRHGLTYKQCIQLRLEEILSGQFSKKEIEARQRGYVFYLDNGIIRILVGWAKERFLKQFESRINQQKTVKGQTVFSGKVRGIVQQGTAYTFKGFKPGRVLVTGMTVPEVTPKIMKARAIVTDEGGITCHAAIIAREFKIPTVIGTKIATQVFKDGDRVEVDAIKGVVKKI